MDNRIVLHRLWKIREIAIDHVEAFLNDDTSQSLSDCISRIEKQLIPLHKEALKELDENHDMSR